MRKTSKGFTLIELLVVVAIIALLIAIFPANIHVYQNQDVLPAPPLFHLLRLPFQGVFILWAYWQTKTNDREIR